MKTKWAPGIPCTDMYKQSCPRVVNWMKLFIGEINCCWKIWKISSIPQFVVLKQLNHGLHLMPAYRKSLEEKDPGCITTMLILERGDFKLKTPKDLSSPCQFWHNHRRHGNGLCLKQLSMKYYFCGTHNSGFVYLLITCTKWDEYKDLNAIYLWQRHFYSHQNSIALFMS